MRLYVLVILFSLLLGVAWGYQREGLNFVASVINGEATHDWTCPCIGIYKEQNARWMKDPLVGATKAQVLKHYGEPRWKLVEKYDPVMVWIVPGTDEEWFYNGKIETVENELHTVFFKDGKCIGAARGGVTHVFH